MSLRQSSSRKSCPGQCILRSFDQLHVNPRQDFLFSTSCNYQCATEKYVNMSYETHLRTGKNHVQGWICFILVLKLQWETGNYLDDVYGRNTVQIKQRGLFVGKKKKKSYWSIEKNLPICLLARYNMNVGVVLSCFHFPEILLRGGTAIRIQF